MLMDKIKFRRSNHGFTVVELLVVIVTIGILATLVMVSYGQSRVSARNTARMAAVGDYLRILSLYDIETGVIPTQSTVRRYCLSDKAPDLNNDSVKECGETPTGKTAIYNTNLITALKTITRDLPAPPEVTSYGPSKYYYGPTLEYYTGWKKPDGTPAPYVVHYWLEGLNQDCRYPAILFDYSASPAPEGDPGSTAVLRPSTTKYSYTDSKVTYCYTIISLDK